MTRRFFIGGGLAAAFAPTGGCLSDGCAGSAYPGWREGELDIHFIHTGVGEQTFFVFPDGTTMLLDCGHVEDRSAAYVAAVPPRPSGNLRGGEWTARYIARVTDRPEIDYVAVSHWHEDHVMGLSDVARRFAFRNWTDHQFPGCGLHRCGADSNALRFAREFLPAAAAKGMRTMPFEVGAANQIALLNDVASRRYPDFEIRNIAANGVLWDGRNGRTDFAAVHVAATGKDEISENQLSASLRIRYGAFTYFTGGDTERELMGADGKPFDWEGAVGAACGPVEVCKTNHHAYWDAMQPGFVRAVRAKLYLSSVWSPNQVNDRNLPIITSRELYPGERTVHLGFMPVGKPQELAGRPYLKDIVPAQGHAVVKVAPGGGSYRLYTLSTEDESMRILRVSERKVGT